MAEETVLELAETNSTTTMEVENLESVQNAGDSGDSEPNVVDSTTNGESKQKRDREDTLSKEDKDGVSKKLKVEEKLEQGVKEEKKSCPVTLGPKGFGSSVEMFDYFFKLLHNWAPNLNINKERYLAEWKRVEKSIKSNETMLTCKRVGEGIHKGLKYEHTMLLELLKKGHTEPDKKIGGGIHYFQVRYHPIWKSRCFFLIREDESVDDFSFRKCVDHIIPLPESMKLKAHVNRAQGGGGGRGRAGKGGGGRGCGHGRGKGGKWRH